jgi:glutathione S-transferase
MKLYGTPKTPSPRRVHAFIAEKGITGIEIVPVDINSGEHRGEGHKGRFGIHHVPILELPDGRFLSETRAICTYLEGIHPDPDLLGANAFEKGEIEMWDRRAELMMMVPMAMWIRHGHPGLAPLENPQLPDVSANGLKGVTGSTAYFSDRLEHSAYVAGDRFTNADITLFCALEFGRVMKFKPWETNPGLARWREEMLARPAGQA